MKKLFFSRRAEQEMLPLITKMFLICIILAPLFVLGYKLVNVFIPKTDESTLKNFDQLVATIQSMEQGDSMTSYPLYLASAYAIVGYPSERNAIGGTCTAYGITNIYENKKPEACGIGNEGCICLCTKNSDEFATFCQKNDDVVKCHSKGKDNLDADISFVGGTYTDTTSPGQCDFALIEGTGSPITVYVSKASQSSSDKDADVAVPVHLCTKECGTGALIASSEMTTSSTT